MRPSELDEYPIHQSPLPMNRVASSDRNFYDRCYLNAFDTSDDSDMFFITGMGFYPNLGVKDAFISVRQGDTQHTLRLSDVLDDRHQEQTVTAYTIDVVEPLTELHLRCAHNDLSIDLIWRGAHQPLLEAGHGMMGPNRPIINSSRFAQMGTWEGEIQVAGQRIAVHPDTWRGSRDRSWGIRGVGEPEPPGRDDRNADGFWWLYCPIWFPDYTLVMICQENPDGFRTLNHASRIYADGRIEQLGWPHLEFDYASGTRHPSTARAHLATPTGEPLMVEFTNQQFIPLHIGCGYGGDDEWLHGQWMGAEWSQLTTYDYSTDEVAGRIPWGVIDHVCEATCNGDRGFGLFEHATIGRHDPTGFADWFAVAK